MFGKLEASNFLFPGEIGVEAEGIEPSGAGWEGALWEPSPAPIILQKALRFVLRAFVFSAPQLPQIFI